MNTKVNSNIINWNPETGQKLKKGENVVYNGQNYTQGQPLVSPIANPNPNNSLVITSDSLNNNTNPYQIPPANTTDTASTALDVKNTTAVGAATSAIADATGNKENDFASLTKDLLSKLQDKGDETVSLQKENDVAGKMKTLNDVNSEMLVTGKAYDDKIAALEKSNEGGTFGGALESKVAALKKEKNSELANLAIRKAVALGDVNTANDIVESTIKAKYEPIENLIDYYQKLSTVINNDLTDSERLLVQTKIQEAKDNADALKQADKDKSGALLDTMQAYPDAGIKITDTIEEANRKITSYSKIYQDKIRAPQGSGGTESERAAAKLDSYGAAFVAGATLPDGTPVLDSNGFATPKAWKQAITDYGNRKSFIERFGYLLFSEGDAVDKAYGLTPQEQKLITG